MHLSWSSDISIRNMVMDTTGMIPGGFHTINTRTEDGVSKRIHVRSRTSAAPVSYFIDFGLVVAYKNYAARGKVSGTVGPHRNIPELSEDIPCDPFKLDIRQIRETTKNDLIAVRNNTLSCSARHSQFLVIVAELLGPRVSDASHAEAAKR